MGRSGRVRIEAGIWGGRSIAVPAGARPSGGKLKGALFSIWTERLVGAAFLDLFAGSGAVGLEALSRGARRVLLVDRGEAALRSMRSAVAALEADRAKIWRADLPRALSPARRVPDAPFDLIFADPPYRFVDFDRLLLAAGDLLTGGGRVAIEHSSRTELSPAVGDLEASERRSYGESALTFFRPAVRSRVGTTGYNRLR